VSDHDRLLEEGARTAPEPETAEERSKRLGLKTGGGAVAGGTIAAAKFGLLGKTLIWFFAWRGVVDAWRIGSWIGLAIALTVAAFFVVRHLRRQEQHS
jgi:hypothetical protein